jgi:hypothetical protein
MSAAALQLGNFSELRKFRVRVARQVGDEQAASACSGKHSAAAFEG